MYDINFTILI